MNNGWTGVCGLHGNFIGAVGGIKRAFSDSTVVRSCRLEQDKD